ncbi:MAG: 2-oxoacid:acceptor oxidoreductase family protein, partial [Coriobacteriaceae bacterium]
QGTVLAAKVLAQAAQSKGWQVRTAETIGMAQRGGNVTSHVRMGSNGGAVYSPLITPGTADMVIALEPGEAARALPYLAPAGVLVTATTAIQPVTAALASQPYRAGDVVAALGELLQAEASREQAAESIVAPNTVTADQDASADGVEGYPVPLFIPVDDEASCARPVRLPQVPQHDAARRGWPRAGCRSMVDECGGCIKPVRHHETRCH